MDQVSAKTKEKKSKEPKEPKELKTGDMAAYRKQYYQVHKDDYKKKEVCETCGFTYALYNKSHHLNSKKHKNAVDAGVHKKIKDELDELKAKIKNLV